MIDFTYLEKRPKRHTDSASTVAGTCQNNPGSLFEDHPLYHHWLAYELYGVYLRAQRQLKENETDIKLTVNNIEFSVSLEALETASGFCMQALGISDAPRYEYGMRHSPQLACQEICQTAVCATALNDLIASRCGKILHQGATRKKKKTDSPETADYYGAVFDQQHRICTPFLVGDGKHAGDEAKALCQTAKYAHDVIEERLKTGEPPPSNPLILGLPLTKSSMCLYAFFVGAKQLWGLPIVKSRPDDLALYATVYAASHYMIKCHRVEVEGLPNEPCLYNYRPLQANSQCRTFHDQETRKVWKFFSSARGYSMMNYDLVRKVFDESKVTRETIGDLQILRYDYYDGDDKASSFRQYSGILLMLYRVHEAGYVHGDIRKANLIFFGDTSYLIDFDLARKEGVQYPEEYRPKNDGTFYMRHVNAVRFKPMCKIHDRFSLQVIMKRYCCRQKYSGEDLAQCDFFLSRLLGDESLKTLADELEKIDIQGHEHEREEDDEDDNDEDEEDENSSDMET